MKKNLTESKKMIILMMEYSKCRRINTYRGRELLWTWVHNCRPVSKNCIRSKCVGRL